MIYIDKESRRNLIFYICILLFNIMAGGHLTNNMQSIIYGFLVLLWMSGIRNKVIQDNVRKPMLMAGFFLFSLFPIRMARYTYFAYSLTAQRYLWYSYYISFTIVPLLCYEISLKIGKETRMPKGLWIAWWIIAAGIMSNDYHHLLLVINRGTTIHGMLYWFICIWCVLLSFLAFFNCIHRCRISASLKYWFIPVIPFVSMLILLVIYYLNDGAPVIGTVKIYNLQEVYTFMYIGLWEGCIQIGLIPSNRGYGDIFQISSAGLILADKENNILNNNTSLGKEQLESYQKEEYWAKDHRVNVKKIIGGKAYWLEDLSTIYALNAELQEVNQNIREENVLLEYENTLKEEKAQYEIQNRLFDHIADIIKPQLERLEELSSCRNEEPLKEMAVLGAYVKRRSNLAILANDQKDLDMQELYFCIQESMEYMKLYGIQGTVTIEENDTCSSRIVESCFEIYQMIAEEVFKRCHFISVVLNNDDFMRIMVDVPGLSYDLTGYPLKTEIISMEDASLCKVLKEVDA